MRASDFDYELPPELVAQEPAERRDAARLLVHERAEDRTHHSVVSRLDEWLRPGDLLVTNDTRVLAARLLGRRASGGAVELLLLRPLAQEPGGWTALVRPGGRARPGEELELEGGRARARLSRRLERDGRPGAEWELVLRDGAGEPVGVNGLEGLGRMPLPPYVRRERVGPDAQAVLDRERYQTVFAREPGAVAAPTAGLHFTPELLERLRARGVEQASVTLHVGLGTFRPVEVEDVSEHHMHSERYVLNARTAAAVAACRARGGRVLAVGTTVVRVLESCAREDGALEPGSGETRLFLLPGHRFRAVDALFTNFHLPRSTLLMLVSAWAGRERVLSMYQDAIARGYRFYSYGDAMLLV